MRNASYGGEAASYRSLLLELREVVAGARGYELANAGVAYVPLTRPPASDWRDQLGDRGHVDRLLAFLQPDPDRALLEFDLCVREMLFSPPEGVGPLTHFVSLDGRWASSSPFENSWRLDLCKPSKKGQRRDANARRVFAAGLRDLQRLELDELGLRLGVGLTSSSVRLSNGEERSHVDDRSRQVKATYAEGRRILASIGAWPWTHFEGGRPPAMWQADEAVRASLRAWAQGDRPREWLQGDARALAEREVNATLDEVIRAVRTRLQPR